MMIRSLFRMVWNGTFKSAVILGFILYLFFPMLLRAGDGQIDIRPTGAATLTISTPGSYVLTDNVTMSANVNCINITSTDVTLDLNGHTITGNASTYIGINGTGMDRIHLYNGTVRNFGSKGVVLGAHCRIRDVTIASCGDNGLETVDGSHVFQVTAASNSGNGIKTGENCLIESCTAKSNGSNGGKAGIYTAAFATIKDCVANGNSNTTNTNVDSYGIYAGAGSAILNNTCFGNNNSTTYNGGKAYGIFASSGCIVKNNTCYQNLATNEGTDATAIYAGSGSIVAENTCTENIASGVGGEATGILCGSDAIIRDNNCHDNNAQGATGANAMGITACNNSIVTGNNCTNNNGTTNSMGIRVTASGTRVENNLCSNHTTGLGVGIIVSASLTDCSIIKNTTLNNDTGIDLGSGTHYCAENILTDGILNSLSATLGTGDRSNVSY